MKDIFVKTNKEKEIIDITEKVQGELPKEGSGFCVIFVKHTTCALTTADLDPGTDLDFLDFLERIVPQIKFRHPHNPEHAPSHLWSSIIGPSVTVPYENGKLQLGTWQRIILVELDGPREREIVLGF